MKLRLIVVTITICFAFATVAQAQDINRWEAFGGFSIARLDNGISSNDPDIQDFFGGRVGANGFNFSVGPNISKYVGIRFDFATHGTTREGIIDGDPFNFKYRTTSYMGGVEFKNNLKDGPRWKPFAHVLAGVARAKITTPDNDFNDNLSFNGFTMAFGGGLDVKVHKHVDIRVIQFEYNPIFRSTKTFIVDPTPPATTVETSSQHNFRIGFGIVVH